MNKKELAQSGTHDGGWKLQKYDRIDFVDEPVNLDLTVRWICIVPIPRPALVALDFMNPNSVREGVKWLPEKQVDVLFVTLNKSDKDYSPTTMYNDYSTNEKSYFDPLIEIDIKAFPTMQTTVKGTVIKSKVGAITVLN